MPTLVCMDGGVVMVEFEKLNGYEKGVLARALLRRLIKQGRLDQGKDDSMPFEVVIPATEWQLELLAKFSDDLEEELAATEL